MKKILRLTSSESIISYPSKDILTILDAVTANRINRDI